MKDIKYVKMIASNNAVCLVSKINNNLKGKLLDLHFFIDLPLKCILFIYVRKI